VERASGSFSRSLTLPEGIEPDAIQASFEKGVLEVRIPKPQERKPHRVAIKVGEKHAVIQGEATPTSAVREQPSAGREPSGTAAQSG
jgi:HSP20 family protein